MHNNNGHDHKHNDNNGHNNRNTRHDTQNEPNRHTTIIIIGIISS